MQVLCLPAEHAPDIDACTAILLLLCIGSLMGSLFSLHVSTVSALSSAVSEGPITSQATMQIHTVVTQCQTQGYTGVEPQRRQGLGQGY